MRLTPGTRLGPYEVTSQIGVGGMGEVYQATDTNLKRQVAIKVLPGAVAADAERLARFQREAEVLASLNHPNIAHIHGLEKADGTIALVMELVEGPTLADRIANGAIPIDDALPIARQIAEALEAAHEQGIIHRDLKPANVKVRPDGTVKVLDFGLAKATEPVGSSPGASMSPTLTIPAMTHAGTILGTAAYMSPEQVRGKLVDKRTDIWAFGVVLFEMLVGQPPYKGTDVADIVAAVMRDEPDWNRLPVRVRRLVRQCLEKNPKRRLRDIRDMELLLEESPRSSATSRAPWLAVSSLLVVALALAAWGWWRATRSVPQAESVRFVVLPPEKGIFDSGAGAGTTYNSGAISPDGHKLAFTVRDSSGRVLIWVRPMDSLNAAPLPGTDGASVPFWSPDNASLAFFADGKLKRIDVGGGPVQILSDIAAPRGGAWSPQGVIVFTRSLQGPLSRVSASGGAVSQATTLNSLQRTHRSPSFLPDGDHYLYFVGGVSENSGIFVGRLSGDGAVRLAESESAAVYAEPGYLLFARQGTLMAQRFDPKTLQLTGPAMSVTGPVGSIQGGPPHSVSLNGTLVYRTGVGAQALQMAWFDRNGKLLQTIARPGGYISPSLAPDGRRIAVHRHEGVGGDIWLIDGDTISPLTFDAAGDDSNPIWSPDGQFIAFSALRNGKWGIYQKAANGTGDEQQLVQPDTISVPMSWSPDGKYLVYSVLDSKGLSDLLAVPLTGDRKPIPIVQGTFNENHAQVSPDGKWVAFNSDEAGANQVFVKPFPSGSGKWRASTSGGTFPRWRRDGRELFFMETSDSGRMMATGVTISGESIQFTVPRALFDSNHINIVHTTNYHTFDVSPDGERFLLARPEGSVSGEAANAPPITVVLNWTGLLRGR